MIIADTITVRMTDNPTCCQMPLTNKPDAPAVSLGEGGDVGLPPITNNLREQFGRILIDKNPLFEYRLARQYRLDLLLCADAGVKRLAELSILWRKVLFKRKSVGRTRRTIIIPIVVRQWHDGVDLARGNIIVEQNALFESCRLRSLQ
ncbi:hypothetical protein RJZ56_003398 [Blastomyces dermatitidis]